MKIFQRKVHFLLAPLKTDIEHWWICLCCHLKHLIIPDQIICTSERYVSALSSNEGDAIDG
jgi:hypothetical protein